MKILKYIPLVLVFLVVSACESEWLDVNTDPNTASTADPALLFTNIINQYSTNRVIDFGAAGGPLAQLWSGGGSLGASVFTNPEVYSFSIFTTGNTWRTYYRNMLKNIELAIQGAEGADPVQNNAAAQCKVIKALTFYSATVLWGDVPYSEAVNVDFETLELISPNPKFDPQQEVLNGVISILDEALAQIDMESPLSIGSNDLIYNGDMEKWRKFAKSLKFRTLMTMVDADPSKAAGIAALINEGDMISSVAENAAFPFFSESGNRNPFWETLNAFTGGQNFFYFGSEAMVELMKKRNDPRLKVYFEPFPAEDGPSPDAEVMGVFPGGNGDPTESWVLSTAPVGSDGTVELVRPASPDVLFSHQEQLFLEAEAIARGLAPGGIAAAEAKMREGVRVAMMHYNIETATIDAYLAGIPAFSSAEEARQVIAEQEWIDLIIRPVEGWTTWRRTEVPALELPEGAQTTNLVRRFALPPDELDANTSAPEPEPLDTKMWFDK